MIFFRSLIASLQKGMKGLLEAYLGLDILPRICFCSFEQRTIRQLKLQTVLGQCIYLSLWPFCYEF